MQGFDIKAGATPGNGDSLVYIGPIVLESDPSEPVADASFTDPDFNMAIFDALAPEVPMDLSSAEKATFALQWGGIYSFKLDASRCDSTKIGTRYTIGWAHNAQLYKAGAVGPYSIVAHDPFRLAYFDDDGNLVNPATLEDGSFSAAKLAADTDDYRARLRVVASADGLTHEYTAILSRNGVPVPASTLSGDPVLTVTKRSDGTTLFSTAMVRIGTTDQWKLDVTDDLLEANETYIGQVEFDNGSARTPEPSLIELV